MRTPAGSQTVALIHGSDLPKEKAIPFILFFGANNIPVLSIDNTETRHKK